MQFFLDIIFFNVDISLNMSYPHIKFYILILHIIIEGTVSQNVDFGLRFHFIESRK